MLAPLRRVVNHLAAEAKRLMAKRPGGASRRMPDLSLEAACIGPQGRRPGLSLGDHLDEALCLTNPSPGLCD